MKLTRTSSFKNLFTRLERPMLPKEHIYHIGIYTHYSLTNRQIHSLKLEWTAYHRTPIRRGKICQIHLPEVDNSVSHHKSVNSSPVQSHPSPIILIRSFRFELDFKYNETIGQLIT